MKKVIFLFISAVLLVSLVPSCANKEASQKKKITLTVIAPKDSWKDVFLEVAKKIEAEHNIAIDLVTLPDEQMVPVLNVKLATNDPPDLFIANIPDKVEIYNATQHCQILDDQPWIDRLVAPELLRYKGNGKIYGMPVNESSTFFGGAYYNKALMEKAGIHNPEPKTYAEFLDILSTLKKAGLTPIYRTDKDTWTTQVWTTLGWAVALDDRKDTVYDQLLTNKIKFSDIPELRIILQQMRDLYAAGYVNEDHMSQTYDTAKSAIGEGKAVMVFQGEWFANDAAGSYPDVELGSFAIPFMDKDMIANGNYVVGWYVPKGENTEAALEFLNYWSQKQYQDMIYAVSPGFPPFKDANGGDVLPAVKNIVEKYISTGKYTPEFNSYVTAANSVIQTTLWSLLQEVCVGTKTPETALAELDQKFTQFMREKEVPGF